MDSLDALVPLEEYRSVLGLVEYLFTAAVKRYGSHEDRKELSRYVMWRVHSVLGREVGKRPSRPRLLPEDMEA